MSRPFLSTSIVELEAALDRQRDDIRFLRTLVDELSRRTTSRAKALQARAVQALGTVSKPCVHAPETPWQPVLPPTPPLRDDPADILSAWTALEVLSPPSFRRPEDLAGGDRRAVARLTGDGLPWQGDGEKARPKTRLYYQVVLGTMDMAAAVSRLVGMFAEARPERPTARGEAVLAVVMVDRAGRPVDAPAVSSFGWGVPRVLARDLRGLGGWPAVETVLAAGLDGVVRRCDDKGELLPLDPRTIRAAFDWLVLSLELPPELVTPPSFAIRSYQYSAIAEPPEPILLNSFYLGDLAAAGDLFRRGVPTPNLARYLGAIRPAGRCDLLADKGALAAAVRPGLIPPARWPAPGRHPLVLLQQAAVNLAVAEGHGPGILAVNGPPGTGKTTLLRDVAAALVTARARVMAGFDDPADAFTHSGERLRAGNAWLHLYKVDERLRGFEMLVASSNNRAVENVSAELPPLGAVAADAGGLRYFKTLADALLGRESWGLIAGVLGNAANRSRFRQGFWRDEDVGLSTYLAAAAGSPRMFQEKDPATGAVVATRPPRIVTAEHPPRDRDEALQRWREARKAFTAALKRSETTLAELEAVRLQAERLPELTAAEVEACRQLAAATATAEQAAADSRDADRVLVGTQADRDIAALDLRRHAEARPGILARLFRTARFRTWRQAGTAKSAVARRAAEAAERAEVRAAGSRRELERATTARVEAATRLRSASEQRDRAVSAVAAAQGRLGPRFVDEAFFARSHAERHKLSPWLDEATQRRRDQVFVAAIHLHKAFIDAAAKPLRHNVGALMDTLGSRVLADAKTALLPHLWASLFLVVPVLSTTFASLGRMLGRLPPEALGWLLIDEAGQALPQAAVGALMRTRRAVVVGDPVQIEPVVVLPETLTSAVCRQLGVNPDRFNAPVASAQTLADAATPFVAEFAGRQGSRTVGVPLLVHRRCAEPMFGISNAIAYEGLMVNAKVRARSAVRDLLGPSRWFDVQGAAEEKWCPQEGELAVDLLRALAHGGVDPDLYLVTPFVVVADNLRRLIRGSGVLDGLTDDPWTWASERVGTVHVVQGREAEAVILVLGAPAPEQTGARGWAGGRPNLLNVAVSRAREVLYVVGNRRLWREAGLFRELDARLPG